MGKERDKERVIRKLSDMFKLPVDVSCGDTKISIIGKNRVIIENYRSIIIYSETLIKIQAKNEIVTVEGIKLRIRYYDQDEMEVYGHISNVKFI